MKFRTKLSWFATFAQISVGILLGLYISRFVSFEPCSFLPSNLSTMNLYKTIHYSNTLHNNNNNNNNNTIDSIDIPPLPVNLPNIGSIPIKKMEDFKNIIQGDMTSDTMIRIKKAENDFESTLRSCLGSSCFDEKVNLLDNSGKKIDRIGLLSPSLSGGETLMKILNRAVDPKQMSKINLISETNVPAYGYGKNHGWSRIIRLVRNILPHAMSLSSIASHDEFDIATPIVLDLQVRQLIRWHCRLSHVAAHTKMLTIFVDDIILRPAFEIEKIITFLGVKVNRNELFKTIKEHIVELESEVDMIPTGPGAINFLIPPNYLNIGLAALEEEMRTTDSLTKWPCKSFNEIDILYKSKKINKNDKLYLSANELAANCSSPYVKCSVPIDNSGG
jgi:hypothetical protein